MNGAAAEPQSEYPTWRAYYVYILLFLLYMFDYIDRFVISSLIPYLKTEWLLSDFEVSLFNAAVFWSILAFTLPIGALVDRWSRKKSIGLMAIIWSLATAAGALTRGFWQLFVTRCVIGVGEAGYVPGGAAMISAIFKPEKRARLIGLWQAAIPLGTALGILLGGYIAVRWGWRSALGIVAAPGLVIAILFFWVKDYKTIRLEKQAAANPSTKVKMSKLDIVKELLRSKSLVLNNLGFTACQFTTTALTWWLATYFQRFANVSVESSTQMTSAVMVLAIVGAPLGGFFTDLWLKKQIKARMLFPAITCALSAALLFAAFMVSPTLDFSIPLFGKSIVLSYQFCILIAMGLVIIMFAPGAVAVTQDVVHPGLRSSSASINIMIQHLLGSALGPLVIGAISDVYGLDVALKFLPIFLLVAGVLFFTGSFFYKKDLDAVEKVKIEFESA